MHIPFTKILLVSAAVGLTAAAQTTPPAPPATPAPTPPAETMTLDTWNAALPFSFNYNGQPSAKFISTWRRSEEVQLADGGEIHRISFLDPDGHLKVTAIVRTFTDYSALDWMLVFTNVGTTDTPIIDTIEPLDWTKASTSRSPFCEHCGGAGSGWDDFPLQYADYFDSHQAVTISSISGLSSSRTGMPYFTVGDANYNGVEAVKGPGGTNVAIGWTGNWSAKIFNDYKGQTLNMVAGMQKTHFLLHPGETVRSPRIVILNWKSSLADAKNLWRQFVLKYYSPSAALKLSSTGHLPIALVTPGAEPMDARLGRIKQIQSTKIPIGLYWVNTGWCATRGSWTPNPALFPNGTKPLLDALHAAGMDMMFSVEPETADPASALLTAHPDWFFPSTAGKPALLNLGNPAARKGITDLISNLVTTTGMTWLHQDFSQEPDQTWAAVYTPDRVGISEIKYISGLYDFWDDLHAQHPDLILDDAANSGRRLDIEAASRCVALWPSSGNRPEIGRRETQELPSWVPLCGGPFNQPSQEPAPGSSTQLYMFRSSYGPCWVLNDPHLPFDDTLRQVAEEYRRIQPFFLGDFYPLSIIPFDPDDTSGVAWQWHRTDLKAGVAFVFRLEKCPFTAVQPYLQALDSKATYDVEVRHGLVSDPVQHMTGADLARIQIPLPDQPGSAVVFYQQR